MRVFFASPQQHNPRVVSITFNLNKHIFSFLRHQNVPHQKNKRTKDTQK